MLSRLKNVFFWTGLAFGSLLVARFVVQSFASPLLGPGDVETTEEIAFLFGKILSWSPFPTLNFRTDWLAYPYGIAAFPQVWCLEKEYFTLFASRLIGPGHWTQIYVILSYGVAALGGYLMLRKEVSYFRAALAGLSLSFFNFYCLHKYPGHFNFSFCHWTALNLVADYVITRRVVRGHPLTAKLLFLRCLLLVLALGQDLGTVAGFSLLSFTLTSGYLLFFQWASVKRTLTLSGKKGPLLLLGLLTAGLAYLYVPLIFQITYEFGKYPFASTGTYWANPIRIFIPWFPFLNPAQTGIGNWLADKPEGAGALSPGWTLLLLAMWGVICTRRRGRGRYHYPLLAMLFLILLYQPRLFPTLKLFPWFQHLRVSGRSTVVFSTLFTLLALDANWDGFSRAARRGWAGVVIFVGALELFTAYVMIPVSAPTLPTPQFVHFNDVVRAAKGVAVLDWPFCVHSGDEKVRGLCLDAERSEPIYTRHRFYDKKTVGLFFGRLVPEMVTPFYDAGWEYLFKRLQKKDHAAVCFLEEEKKFFLNFLGHDDFAGVIFYPDLLPKSCGPEMRAMFGEPTVSGEVPVLGRAEFFPRPVLNVTETPKYRPVLRSVNINFRLDGVPDLIYSEGLRAQSPWPLRVELPHSKVRFSLDQENTLRLQIRAVSFFPGQRLRLVWNGREIQPTTLLGDKNDFLILGRPGENELEIQFSLAGEWPEIFKNYYREMGAVGFLNLLRLQRYYNEYRRRVAELESFSLERR